MTNPVKYLSSPWAISLGEKCAILEVPLKNGGKLLRLVPYECGSVSVCPESTRGGVTVRNAVTVGEPGSLELHFESMSEANQFASEFAKRAAKIGPFSPSVYSGLSSNIFTISTLDP